MNDYSKFLKNAAEARIRQYYQENDPKSIIPDKKHLMYEDITAAKVIAVKEDQKPAEKQLVSDC